MICSVSTYQCVSACNGAESVFTISLGCSIPEHPGGEVFLLLLHGELNWESLAVEKKIRISVSSISTGVVEQRSFY